MTDTRYVLTALPHSVDAVVAVPRLGRGVAPAVARAARLADFPVFESLDHRARRRRPDRHRPHRCAVHDHRAAPSTIPPTGRWCSRRRHPCWASSRSRSRARSGTPTPRAAWTCWPRWCTWSRWPATRSTRPCPARHRSGPPSVAWPTSSGATVSAHGPTASFWLDETRLTRFLDDIRADRAARSSRSWACSSTCTRCAASTSGPSRPQPEYLTKPDPGRGERAAEADRARLPPARGPARRPADRAPRQLGLVIDVSRAPSSTASPPPGG